MSEKKYWNGAWPNIGSIAVSLDGISHLSPTETGVLYRLVWFIACQCGYSQFREPSRDPHIPDDEKIVVRIACCSKSEWRACKDAVMEFFVSDGVRIRLRDHSFIRFTKEASRSAVPSSTRSHVLHRDGNRCVYCGDEDGPFHFDHLYPRSKGGTDLPDNIVIACAPCNLSKGDKTLQEWISRR